MLEVDHACVVPGTYMRMRACMPCPFAMCACRVEYPCRSRAAPADPLPRVAMARSSASISADPPNAVMKRPSRLQSWPVPEDLRCSPIVAVLEALNKPRLSKRQRDHGASASGQASASAGSAAGSASESGQASASAGSAAGGGANWWGSSTMSGEPWSSSTSSVTRLCQDDTASSLCSCTNMLSAERASRH